MKMKIFFHFTLILVLVSSAPNLSEEELINQLLVSIRSDLLAAKHTEASEQRSFGAQSRPTHFSSPYISFLYEKGNERELNKALLMAVRDLNSARSSAVFSTHNEAEFFKVLEQHLQHNTKEELGSSRVNYKISPHYSSKERQSEAIPAVYGGVQDIDPKATKIFTKLFTCIVFRSPQFVESLKKDEKFGESNPILNAFYYLADKKKSLEQYLSGIFDRLSSNPDEKLVVKIQQSFNLQAIRNLARDMLQLFTSIAPKSDDIRRETFRHVLNIIHVFLSPGNLNAENEADFDTSIKFLLNTYVFKQIDNMEGSMEAKQDWKNRLSSVTSYVVKSLFKYYKNGEKLSPGDRSSLLLKNIITLLAGINVGITNDTSLFHVVDHILSKDPSYEELQTKAQCLVALYVRNGLGAVLKVLTRLTSDDIGNTDPRGCAVDAMVEALNVIRFQIPDQLGNVKGCEDFGMNFEEVQRVSIF